MPRGGLCPWPTFHAWVTMVRKKWLSLCYSAYWCYIHQTCTNCSSWQYLLMPSGGLCPWPTFHAWVTMVRKKWLSLCYMTYWCYIHQTCTNCSSWHDLLIPCGSLCPWPTFHAWVTKTQNGNSGAPVMVPITIMSSSVRVTFHVVQWFKLNWNISNQIRLKVNRRVTQATLILFAITGRTGWKLTAFKLPYMDFVAMADINI